MSILVTVGAGFIGSNFVLDWLSASSEPVVNLDKLTYAGNLENLERCILWNDATRRIEWPQGIHPPFPPRMRKVSLLAKQRSLPDA